MARTVWTYIRNIILACSIVCFAGLSQLEIYYGVLGGENTFGAGQVAKICIGVAIVAGITGLVLIFRFQHLWTKLFQIPEWQFGLYMLLSVYACGLYTRHLTELAPAGVDLRFCRLVAAWSLLAFYLFFQISYRWAAKLCKSMFCGERKFARHELVFLGLFIVLAGAAMIAAFAAHPVLHDGTGWGVVYTFDSQRHVALDVYAMIDNPENDLRNPFFGFFTAPFAIPCHILDSFVYLLFQVRIYAFLIGILQIAAIAVSILLFARMASKNIIGRICVYLLFSSGYTFLLNLFILEQYAFSLLGLAICIYSYVNDLSDIQPVTGAVAAGYIPSNALILGLPVLKSKPGAFRIALKSFGLCVLILLITGKAMRILSSVFSMQIMYERFCVSGYSPSGRIEQFLYSIRTVFLQPAVRDVMVPADDGRSYMTYLMQEVPDISAFGCLVLILAIAGLVLNYRDEFSQFCGWWIFVSCLISILVGWGTADNGLIIYTMYFGWTYVCLLYKLVEHVFSRKKYVLAGGCALFVGYMAVTNISGLFGLFQFLKQYY